MKKLFNYDFGNTIKDNRKKELYNKINEIIEVVNKLKKQIDYFKISIPKD